MASTRIRFYTPTRLLLSLLSGLCRTFTADTVAVVVTARHFSDMSHSVDRFMCKFKIRHLRENYNLESETIICKKTIICSEKW